MAKIIFSLNQSLDGYVDHIALPRPGPTLSRHFVDQVRSAAGGIYGRRMYEIVRYWDSDQPDWDKEDHEFAMAWRQQPKWVVSRTLESVGSNATLVKSEIETVIRRLKNQLDGDIRVGGTGLARTLTDLGLIDEYQLYLHPVVLGSGTPFFAAARPPLRLVGSDMVGDGVIRVTYVPA
jgi:dihydrofolate reductase